MPAAGARGGEGQTRGSHDFLLVCTSERLKVQTKDCKALLPLQIKKSVTDFAKTAKEPAPEKLNADEGVYYLVNPDGEFERAFGHDIDSLAIALAVCIILVVPAECIWYTVCG